MVHSSTSVLHHVFIQHYLVCEYIYEMTRTTLWYWELVWKVHDWDGDGLQVT